MSEELIVCRKVDLNVEKDCNDLLHLLRIYAMDPMGGGEDLSTEVQQNLIPSLQKRSSMVHAFIASVNGEPAGLGICFEGFSTFACKPLLNIHDFVTAPAFRRKKVGVALLTFIENYAREIGCCKVTLEVLQGNINAMALYRHMGFAGYELDPEMGQAVFWQKKL